MAQLDGGIGSVCSIAIALDLMTPSTFKWIHWRYDPKIEIKKIKAPLYGTTKFVPWIKRHTPMAFVGCEIEYIKAFLSTSWETLKDIWLQSVTV